MLTCFRPNTEVHKQICILSWQFVDLSISNLCRSISLFLFMSYLLYHQTKAVSYTLQITQRKVKAEASPKSKVISTIKQIQFWIDFFFFFSVVQTCMRATEIQDLCIKCFYFISLCHRDFYRAK